MRTGFIKQNINFEQLQELQGRPEEFLKTATALSYGLYCRLMPHTLTLQTFS
jgi:hypothetical protein